jgi:uracil-DNA glycosylase
MTNLILCLKEGGLQAPVQPEWLSCCARTFLVPLIAMIKPAVVLGLGQKTSAAILDAHGVTCARSASYADMVGAAPYRLVGETWLFPLYHCGAGSVNRNRSFAEQEADWGRVTAWMDTSSSHRG